ncbi:hypothetical protein NQ318_019175 [Aromia moschata]|uniref:BAG domain-containing protein n=1 Tax=Aromia moschata TaxID=1265417 RepID=A0AAV8YSW1_9CUCU|nr:hypothetical protein NQ318_019175 [Aromia moschata]
MSLPAVDTVRNIPLVVEHGRYSPMEDEEISGFPFNREGDRDEDFRSQLDDIAKRHPEFAEHLGNLRTGNVRRQSSLGGTDEPDNLHRRFQRPFGSRFEGFGFPFDRDNFNPEQYAQQFYQPHQEFHQQSPSSYQQQYPPSYHEQPSSYQQQSPSYSEQQPEYQQAEYHQQPQNTEEPLAPESRNNNIHQSNTVDLGQKQEPVNERSQRSMSAPPSEKGQRFTSSIKIPVNQSNQEEDMAQTQSPQQPANAKTTERIIPIHVEDRDEPVMPKKSVPTYSQPHSTFGGSPQPETIFGRRPEEFTHFMNREPRQYEKWHSGFNHPDEFVRQQRFPQQQSAPHQQQQQPAPKQQPQPKGDIPIPVKVEVPLNKQKATQQQRAASPKPQPQQHAAPPQQEQPQNEKPLAPQQKKPLTPLEQIQTIQKDVSALAAQVEQFSGAPKDKRYLYLDEMLTRNLLKLDNIDTQGQDDIRTARKDAIKNIEKTIGILESKAAANVEPAKGEAKMEVEEKSVENPIQPMDAEPAVVESGVENKGDGSQPQEQPMEVAPADPLTTAPEPAQEDESKPINEEPKVEPDQTPSENSAVQMADKVEAVPVENRAVLVENKPNVVENKPEVTDKQEIVENRAVLVDKKPGVEETSMETCEGQESNLAVADAVKKFEGNAGEQWRR